MAGMSEDPNEVNQKKIITPQIATRELGRTGLIEYSGYVYEEQLKQLSSFDTRVRVYKEMSENDSVIGAILFVIDMLIRQVSWRVQAGGSDLKDEEAKVFLESCLLDMSSTWEDTISEIMSFLIYGFSYHEIVYKRRFGDNRDPTKKSRFTDGRIGWRKMPIRAQETLWRWLFDEGGGIQGMIQLPPPDYQYRTIPIEKALLFRTGIHKNNPEGRSILRVAYRTWYIKKRIETYEAIGVERELAGYPVVYVPVEWTDVNATAGEKDAYVAMKKLVTNIRRDEQEGAVLPAIYDEQNNQLVRLELLTSGGRRNFDTNQIITRLDQRLAMTVMADFILLGTATPNGSYALSSDKTKLFSTALGTWLDSIAATFNRYAIPRLFALNNFGVEKLPTLEHGDVESQDLKELGEYISKLAGAGAPLFPNDELEDFLKKTAGLPVSAKD
jgi:hypothetical protein